MTPKGDEGARFWHGPTDTVFPVTEVYDRNQELTAVRCSTKDAERVCAALNAADKREKEGTEEPISFEAEARMMRDACESRDKMRQERDAARQRARGLRGVLDQTRNDRTEARLQLDAIRNAIRKVLDG